MSRAPARVDQSGRVLGPKAQQTRQRLLDATHALLARRGLRELRVVEIARKIGTSPATFYQYFSDVEEAVLSLAEQAGENVPAIVEVYHIIPPTLHRIIPPRYKRAPESPGVWGDTELI